MKGFAVQGASRWWFFSLFCLVVPISIAGCDLFAARTPEDPITEAGTYLQPDAPDIVVENMQAAIAEMNTANYRRSLAPELLFEPTAAALARDPSLFSGWGQPQEVSYFTTLVEAARLGSGHSLRLIDQTEEVGDTRYVLDATYVLVVNHRRPNVPDTLQGQLIWEIIQRSDGLWYLQGWRDQELGNNASWSDLKAEFGK